MPGFAFMVLLPPRDPEFVQFAVGGTEGCHFFIAYSRGEALKVVERFAPSMDQEEIQVYGGLMASLPLPEGSTKETVEIQDFAAQALFLSAAELQQSGGNAPVFGPDDFLDGAVNAAGGNGFWVIQVDGEPSFCVFFSQEQAIAELDRHASHFNPKGVEAFRGLVRDCGLPVSSETPAIVLRGMYPYLLGRCFVSGFS